MTALRFAELFAGAGGLSMGLERAGWECVWHAELAESPRAILSHRWPETPLYGDVTTLDGAQLTAAHGAIDLLSGGSPCQDLSVAGKRAGLGGDRSSLFFEQMRLWDETGADLCLWENVDGARSSNEGRDFGEVLRAFVGAAIAVPSDGWRAAGVAAGPTGVAAWRVLDAQFFGVAQRRRRVFVLGTRTGRVDPAEVLSLAEGLRGDSSPRREAREDFARATRASLAFALRGRDEGSVAELSGDITNALRGASGGSSRDMVVAFNTKQDGADADVTAPTPLAMSHDRSHANGGGQIGVVAFDTTQITHPENRSNPQVGDPCHPLASAGHAPTVIAFHQIQDPISDEELSPALGAKSSGMGVVAFDQHNQIASGVTPSLRTNGQNSGAPVVCLTGDVTHALTHEGYDDNEAQESRIVVGTLDARTNGGGFPGSDGAMSGHVQAPAGIPRRLTPRECERLMSWPDDHTLVPDAKGKLLSDAARYKACGNGVASVHTHWIGWRLSLALLPSCSDSPSA